MGNGDWHEKVAKTSDVKKEEGTSWNVVYM
jgi:hypothetical protein